MPRIRKQTSNRGTTFQRSKIGKKAAETRKKNKRSAKKDVTWKSKKTKDPGIPNSFPYKDQILAEVAEQRRINEEEKIRIREERIAARAGPVPADEETETGIDTLGVNMLKGTRVKTNGSRPAVDDDEDEDGEGAEAAAMEVDQDGPAPLLFDAELPTLQSALERADVMLEVVDARDPMGFRSPWLEELFATPDEEGHAGKVVIALTKIDLVPREALQQWLLFLRPRFPVVLFKSRFSASTAAGPSQKKALNVLHPLPPTPAEQRAAEDRRARIAPEEVLGRQELLDVLEGWAKEKKAKKGGNEDPFTITVVGLPNVGKSSLINTLLDSSICPVAPSTPVSTQSGPTTNTPASYAYTPSEASTPLRFIDTPGWIFMDVFPGDLDGDSDEEAEGQDDEEDEEMREETEEEAEMWDTIEVNKIKDLLRRNIGRIERIKEPIPLVSYLVHHCNSNDLMLLYSTPAFQASDPASFLTSVARSQGRLKKGSIPDQDAAARLILRDWSLGRFPAYTVPPSKGAALEPRVPAEMATLSLFKKGEEAVLERVRTRREFVGERGGRGLVRMRADDQFAQDGGDDREVVLDDELKQDEEESDEEDEEEWDDEEDEEDLEFDGEGDEVFPQDQEPSDLEDDADASDEEEDDPSAPSILDILSASNPALLVQSSSKKRSAPSSAPAPSTRPSKKQQAARRKVAFAERPKPQTPNGNGTVDEEHGKGPVSILKTKGSSSASVTDEEAAPSKKGKKGKKTEAPVAPAVASPAIGKDAVEIAQTAAPAKGKGKKEKKAATAAPSAPAPAVPSPAAPASKAKKAKAAVPAAAAAPVKPTKSKAADAAAAKGEVPYSFDSHFF